MGPGQRSNAPGPRTLNRKVRPVKATASRLRKVRICRTCPADISMRGNSAVYCPPCRIAAYTRPTERPCKNDSCENMVQRSGRVYPNFCSEQCKPRCSFEPCSNAQRKFYLCESHYGMQLRGEPLRPLLWQWIKLENCKTCGLPNPEDRQSGAFCTRACGVHWRIYGGAPPKVAICVQCDGEIELTVRTGRYRRRADTLTCAGCQRRYDPRRVMSKNELAARDGTECAECAAAVDLDLSWPDLMCGSVDHIHPRSRGGGDDPENLQLVHLICNLRKGARAHIG